MTMLEVVDQVAQERHANPRLYEMLVGALAALAVRDSPMVAPAFFLKVLVLEGSAPVLDACASCGEDDPASWSPSTSPRRRPLPARAGAGAR